MNIKILFLAILFISVTACDKQEKELRKPDENQERKSLKLPQNKMLIAYNKLVDPEKGNYDIFVMNVDGSNQRNITNSSSMEWVYHSCGGKLYFISDRDTTPRLYHIFEMNPDGSDIRRVTDFLVPDSKFSSRYDCTEFIVTTTINGVNQLFIIDSAGGVINQLTDDDIQKKDPIFSPDGRYVVFRYWKTGKDELWLLDIAENHYTQVSNLPKPDTLTQPVFRAAAPCWLEKREKLTYASFREGNHSIYIANTDGTRARRFTMADTEEIFHDWSQDENLMVYAAFDPLTFDSDIFIINFDGSDVRKLTDDKLVNSGPVFVKY